MGSSLVNLLVGLSLLPLFSAMLLDQADFILVKVLKYVLVVKAWDRMHYLTLFSVIVIGDSIKLMVIEIRGDKVRLGIEAPRDVSVHREEVYDAIRRESTSEPQS